MHYQPMIGAGLFAGLCALFAQPALAQSSPDSAPPSPGAASTGAGEAAPAAALGSSATAAPASPGDAAQATLARLTEINRLRPMGQSTDFAGVTDSIVRDQGGIRSALFEKGIFFDATTIHGFTQDVNGGRSPTSPQRFSGQKFTYGSSNNLRVSFRLADDGTDLTQLNVGGLYNASTWRQLGGNQFTLTRLDLSASLFDQKVQVTGGLGTNILNYIGIFAGGNPILANGLAGTIPIQVGLSGSVAPVPLLNVRLQGPAGLYSKTGLQRSIGPDGLVEEGFDNGIGLKLTRRGAKPLLIQEFGLQRKASATDRQIWLRAGGIYNTTRYTRFDAPGTRKNWMLFALADYQLYQPDAKLAYRGVYVGASAMFAPDKVNVYTRTFEARTYALGMVPGRPADQMSLTFGYNKFSRPAGIAIAALGETTNKYQASVSALYAYRASSGIYVAPSVAYIRHPSFTGDFDPAVNLSLSLSFLL
ncbi:carbohydrate porin [Sphingomonas solaris]|uniref:Carbohydrate porin n=1 Tax=Alterirhizorhabdus solaris TaxID=2529389 RepID=A0A558RA52_9SPHN|nr:carbohydrate porin [Sphingomonas solaris]TVV76259.1 carbohydrate porin [Sphingomonas solaris]